MRVGFARPTKTGVTTFQESLYLLSCKASHAQGSIRIAGSEVWVANKWSHIRNGKMQVFRSSLNVFTVFFLAANVFSSNMRPLAWKVCKDIKTKTFNPTSFSLYHHPTIAGTYEQLPFRCFVCFYELNAFSRKLLFHSHQWFQCYFKKVSLWNSPKRFHAVLSASRYTWWPLFDLTSLRSLFLIKIFFIGGQSIPVFLS